MNNVRDSIKLTMKKKTGRIVPLVPKGAKILYTKDKILDQQDYDSFLSILQTQGINWDTLRSDAEKYVMIGKLAADKESGGPSLKKACYFYAHTIDNFGGTQIPETIIYVGISGDEDITKIGLQGQFGRAYQKCGKQRNWLWHTMMDKVEGHKVNILGDDQP